MMNKESYETILTDIFSRVRKKVPVVHHITNNVTMNDCANIVSAIGGSPIMAVEPNEMKDIISFSNALVVNIGTLTENKINSILMAGKYANELNIPVILDPVGAGATSFRFEAVQKLISEIKFSVIKGNMSEIKTLAGLKVSSKGVDNDTDDNQGDIIVKNFAKSLNCTICATGKVDMLSDGEKVILCHNGHEYLSSISGTGCMTGSLIGAFCGVTSDYLLAAVTGISVMGIAGEKAYESLKTDEGIGTYKLRIFDYINLMSMNKVNMKGVVRVE